MVIRKIAGFILIGSVLAGCETATQVSQPTVTPGVDLSGREGGFARAAAPVVQSQVPSMPGAADTSNTAQANRIISYSGEIRLVVADVRQTLDSIKSTTVSMGGYLQEMDASAIIVRIPVAKFDDAVTAIKLNGEVLDQQIKAVDVTDQMRDLDIRLANAEQTRERLLKLVDVSTKVEDTVKIEDELEKVTETIELIKGKIRAMKEEVAYSVLRVDLNSRTPLGQTAMAGVPFRWVSELGQGVVSGATPQSPDSGGMFSGGVGFELPSGFVRYFQVEDLTEAMSADGMFIQARRHDNYKGGDLEFWSKLARRMLVENHAVAMTSETDVKSDGKPAKLFEGTKDIPGGQQAYMLLIVTDRDHVYTFEAWGPKSQMQTAMDSLEKSAKTVD